MSITAHPARPSRRLRVLLTGSAVVALVAAGAAAGSPAVAAPAMLPVVRGGQAVERSVVVQLSALDGTRAAFESLPNSDEINIDQILKNLAMGLM